MRVLVAYEGSLGSEMVVEHLRRQRAGLPDATPPRGEAILAGHEDHPRNDRQQGAADECHQPAHA